MTPTDERIVSFSYGGGVQSTAALVLAAQGRIDFPLFLFANVGEKAENPGTLDYVRDIAMPFAFANGIELVELAKTWRGDPEDLWDRLMRPGSRSLPIPVRMSNGAPGTRSCTADFKIRVVAKELKRRGATAERPATVGIGISLDEIQRAGTRRVRPDERVVYPLLDLRLRRVDCERIIRSAGLPVPEKSSCFFCPFHRPSVWQAMRVEQPDLFERSAELEDELNRRRDDLGKDHVYLTRFARPLREVVPEGVQMLPFADEDGHDDGCGDSCFT